MVSFYRKLLLSPLFSYIGGPEMHAGQEDIAPVDTRTEIQKLQDYAKQISLDGVDNSDVQLVLAQMQEDREALTNEVRQGEREIVISMLEDIGAQIAQGNLEGIFQAKWRASADRRIVFDSYEGFGGDETQALSRSTVAGLIEKLGMSRDDIISALGVGNEHYADMLVAGDAQRGPSPEQIQEMQAMQEVTPEESDETMQEVILSAQDYFKDENNLTPLSGNEIDRAVQIRNSLGFTPEDIENAGLTMQEVENEYQAAMDARRVAINAENEDILMADGFDTRASQRDISMKAEDEAMSVPIDTDVARREIQQAAEDEAMSIALDTDNETIQEALDAEDIVMSQELDTDNDSDLEVAEVSETDEPQIPEATQNLESQSPEYQTALIQKLREDNGKVSFSEIRSNKELTGLVQKGLIATLGITKIQEILARPDMTEEKFDDGVYGNWTSSVVSEYQRANNLTVDGAAGTQTFASMSGLEYDTQTRIALLPQENDYTVYANNDNNAPTSAI